MIWAWIIFIGFVFAMLALDLGVFHRKSHVVGFKESLGWSAVWITLGLSFSVLVYFAYEHHWFDLGNTVLAVILAILTTGIITSLIVGAKDEETPQP
jgi:tellurite resistance protein TerC